MQNPDLVAAFIQHLTKANRAAYALLKPDLTIGQHSAGFERFLNNPSIDITAQPLSSICDVFVGSEEVILAVLASEQPIYQLRNVQQFQDDGSLRYISYEVTPMPATDGYGLLLIEDTTETAVLEQQRVQERNELRLAKAQLGDANEELKRLNRLKSLFLSMAAHDLRTPLTVILGFTQLLAAPQNFDVSPKQKEYLNTIASQAEWLDRLIANLLSLDQIEEGKLNLLREMRDLNTIVSDTVEFMQGMVASKYQTLTFECPPDPTLAYVDSERVQQVVYNLVGNAVKYTPPNGTIQVKIWRESETAVLCVQDNGRGMSKKEQSHLFELYYRTDAAKQEKIKGTGLGLFIVKTLVEVQNGRIGVDSAINKGTKFTVWFPNHPPSENE